MIGFHPVAVRIVDRNGVGVGAGNPPRDDSANDDDEVESDFSDFDQPYHETALDWHNRHARRRARRLAGVSSDSSSSSSEDCSGLESGDDFEGNGDGDDGGKGGSKGRREMEKASLSAIRPLAKWMASYPLVASRCCFSSVAPTMSGTTMDAPYGKAQFNNSVSSLPPREQETKRLRRIFRRLNRKQKEFQAKFVENNQASEADNSSYYQTSNALSPEQIMRIDQDCAETGSDQLAIHSFLPQGTGISFIDAALARDSRLQYKSALESSSKEQRTSSRLVLELNGPPRSGKTSILLAAAARYVVSTSNVFLGTDGHGCGEGGPTTPDEAQCPGERRPPTKRRKRNSHPATASVDEPRVVVLDLEKGVHVAKLVLSIREAVLRRLGETAAAREWKKGQEKLWKLDGAGGDAPDDHDDAVEDRGLIDLAIASCLGRIHVVRPRDFTYLSLVATIELLGHSLDRERAMKNPMVETKKARSPQFGRPKRNDKPAVASVAKQQEPPTLILIDSLSTLDESTRFQEGLAAASGSNRSSGGSGLSDRNSFYRQLIRLREEHEIIVLGASRSVPGLIGRAGDQGPGGGPSGGKRVGNTLFDKMVSHRICLHHVAEGTSEDQAGYDFVATLNANDDRGGARIFPYSVTAGGIAC